MMATFFVVLFSKKRGAAAQAKVRDAPQSPSISLKRWPRHTFHDFRRGVSHRAFNTSVIVIVVVVVILVPFVVGSLLLRLSFAPSGIFVFSFTAAAAAGAGASPVSVA
jgi:hypothetical protein